MTKVTIRLRCLVVLLFLFNSGSTADAQEIVATEHGKMPAVGCGSHCIQVVIGNLMQDSVNFALRRPGQNWQNFTLPPGAESSFSWKFEPSSAVPDRLQIRLEEDEAFTWLKPGIEYEIDDDPSRKAPTIFAKRAKSK